MPILPKKIVSTPSFVDALFGVCAWACATHDGKCLRNQVLKSIRDFLEEIGIIAPNTPLEKIIKIDDDIENKTFPDLLPPENNYVKTEEGTYQRSDNKKKEKKNKKGLHKISSAWWFENGLANSSSYV